MKLRSHSPRCLLADSLPQAPRQPMPSFTANTSVILRDVLLDPVSFCGRGRSPVPWRRPESEHQV